MKLMEPVEIKKIILIFNVSIHLCLPFNSSLVAFWMNAVPKLQMMCSKIKDLTFTYYTWTGTTSGQSD